MMFFELNARPEPVDGSRLGFRSPLVLAKLGFDLRASYDAMIEEPLPPEISRLIWALPGARITQVR
jgi:hypothetical protein